MESGSAAADPGELLAVCRLDADAALAKLNTTEAGLTNDDAESRIRLVGANLVGRERTPSIAQELLGRANNPLNLMLLVLAGFPISWETFAPRW